MKIEDFKNKKILVLGLQKEGIDVLNFLKKLFPEKEIGIADFNSEVKKRIKYPLTKKVKWHLGTNYLDSLEKYDIIIKSPGIPIHIPIIEKLFKKGKIISATEIFFENCQGKIIGITSTKGKSTTSTLIYKILKSSPEFKKKVHLIGNIGKPFLYFLFTQPNDIFVFELSSHQLYNLKKSPHIAVFLNIFPEHLDYYRDFEEYKMAKANITLHQTTSDYLIYNPKDKNIEEIAKYSKAKKIPITNPKIIIKNIGIKKIFLPEFYYLNIAAAIEVAKIFEIKNKDIKKVIENFKTLPHRLEFVGKFKGIYFYNDSLSTLPEATIFALKNFKKRVKTLILGGYDRGLDFKNLVSESLKNGVKTFILFPPSGERIWQEILKKIKDHSCLPKVILVQNMKDAVKTAFKFTQKGEICLLSPASPSFGIFKNYKERGNLFKKYVKYYGKKIR